jgi:predicted nuclease of restriction endonuclease-like (RecB) superfamily
MNDAQNLIDENKLYKDVSHLIESTQQRVLQQISQAGVLLYWKIGYRLNEDVLKCNRADYGKAVINNLTDKLNTKYGKGYSRSVIYRCVQFSKLFDNKTVIETLSAHLKWTHFVSLLTIDDKIKREFYAEMCRIERWSTRTLDDKLSGMLFERTAIAKKPEAMIESEIKKMRNTNVINPDFIIQDPYVFQYLGDTSLESEKTFENAIINDIEKFLLDMGGGFTFQERQKVIEVDGIFYKIDLLMYSRRLQRMIVIELKKGRFRAEHKGQTELYLRWLEKYEMQPNEKPPIAIVLCTEKSDAHIELLQLEKSGIRVSKVMTDLPSKEIFEERLNQAIQRARELHNEKKSLENNMDLKK